MALGATAVAQLAVFLVSGSVALLADTIHNFSDALTAVPLWVAFVLARRAPTTRYTYGYGRAEDLAGVFIVAMIALSAVVACWESIHRLVNPQSLDHVGAVLAAGVLGFMGNEAVAVYRIRVGRKISSAALVADGLHARTDGFTSLAVAVLAAAAIIATTGWLRADALASLVIGVLIIPRTIGLLRESVDVLLESTPKGLDLAGVRAHHDAAARLNRPVSSRSRRMGTLVDQPEVR